MTAADVLFSLAVGGIFAAVAWRVATLLRDRGRPPCATRGHCIGDGGICEWCGCQVVKRAPPT